MKRQPFTFPNKTSFPNKQNIKIIIPPKIPTLSNHVNRAVHRISRGLRAGGFFGRSWTLTPLARLATIADGTWRLIWYPNRTRVRLAKYGGSHLWFCDVTCSSVIDMFNTWVVTMDTLSYDIVHISIYKYYIYIMDDFLRYIMIDIWLMCIVIKHCMYIIWILVKYCKYI